MKKIAAELLPIGSMTLQDRELFADWVWQMRHLNMFDMNVIGYPRTAMVRAGSEGEPLLYVPVQSVLMYESLAPKPGITPRQEALCLKRVVDEVDAAARDIGMREVYFLCRDDRVANIAAAHGFEEIKDVRVLRRKMK